MTKGLKMLLVNYFNKISITGYLIKGLILIIIIQVFSLFAIGQIDSVSRTVLYSIIRDEQPNDRIVYCNKLSKEILQGLRKHLGGTTIKGLIPGSKMFYLKLDKNDREIIRRKLNSFSKLEWKEDLFVNSERIPSDSMWAYIYNGLHEITIQVQKAIERGDTAMVRKINMSYGFKKNYFTFTPPIFIKHGEIAIIFYVRMCGPECGVDSLAAYRLENGRYKKWLRIEEGVY